MKTKQEFSAGGCVFKRFKTNDSGFKIKWLIGVHSGYGKWVLPKGMIEEGEPEMEAAVRETHEEMGVEARIVGDSPVYEEQYSYEAVLKDRFKIQDSRFKSESERRVVTYQENEGFGAAGEKVKVEKTVKFFLMEWVSGDPKDHDWEMSEAGWFTFEEALEKLAFEGEKSALRKAAELLVGQGW